MNLNLITSGIILIFAVISIIVGIFALRRLAGRLKLAVIFLILSLFIVGFKELLISLRITMPNWWSEAVRIMIMFFNLMAILCIMKMIQLIDGKYGRVLKYEKKGEEKNAHRRKEKQRNLVV